MLATALCWLLYDGDRIIILATTFIMLVILNRFPLMTHQHLKSVTNIPKSPTHFVSNIRYQHRCSRIIAGNKKNLPSWLQTNFGTFVTEKSYMDKQ